MPGDFQIPFEESWLDAPDLKEWSPRSAPVDAISLISVLDLTALRSRDSATQIEALARNACGYGSIPPCAAVCIYPVFADKALAVLHRIQGPLPTVKVAVVAGGFPHGLSPLPARIDEIKQCTMADEIDVVIRRDLAMDLQWQGLYDEVSEMRIAAKSKTLKVILEVGDLIEPTLIYRAGLIALMAGADFIKTSTGKEVPGPTLDQGYAMTRALRYFQEKTGQVRGLKAAGGIRTYSEAQRWFGLVYHELGADACGSNRFRIGASSLWDDLIAHER